jgi:hypothetical protein|nr:FlgD immunoglobulin-like domain containing protein [Candidatus Krumholzibacteria bacterium]
MMFAHSRFLVLVSVALLLLPGLALAAGSLNPQAIEGPVALALPAKAAVSVPLLDAGTVDIHALRTEDSPGEAPRFADPSPVFITPDTDGAWTALDDRYDLWQLRVNAPGALSLNFGFTDFALPKGARLTIYPADLSTPVDARGVRVFTERDNRPHGELWTPVVVSDDVILELVVPAESRQDYSLELTQINRGFRFLGEEADKQGSCNIDVVCPEGDPWWSEINSVGVYTINGTWYCTGAVINNTAEDQTPYFLTANHCDVSTSNDQGVVIYWNFQSPVCGQLSGGSLDQFSSGVTYLASGATSDFCLVEINDPLDPAWGVTFSGWDRSGADLAEAIAIHHPSTDEKSISFEYDATTTTSYLNNSVPGDGSHIRVIDWDLGTTEPGSSGSPLYDSAHRIVGQLHGGYAACGNNSSDWYGKLSVSWSSLDQWLDPLNSGAVTLDTFDPNASGMSVSNENFAAQGNAGGPFTPASVTYTVGNNGDAYLSYSVTGPVWVDVQNGTGSLAPGQDAAVTLSINASASSLPNGGYPGTVSFFNLTDGDGDATRDISLQVGLPSLVYSEDLTTNPGWSTEGDWAYGTPTGQGGDHGNPDPTAGYTGSNVYGYNLDGDYPAYLDQTYLTSTAFDCSQLVGTTVRFWRYLNVEQPQYDHASFEVSSNGVDFTEIWTNSAGIEDDAWNQVEYDISDVADGQETVYLRWVMGSTDSSWQYSGWNIDDLEIWGLVTGATSASGETPGYRLELGNYPNPFNPLTRVAFTLERGGATTLQVFDVQGRLVRTLLSEELSAGPHSVIWDGLDGTGRRAGSGLYFARLVSGDQVTQHKMVLLK